MKGINPKLSFFIARYVIFALFAICNAIISSVAVWNHSFVISEQASQVAVYLIVMGAFSLASIFTLIFVELLCTDHDPFTTRVWFECGWLLLFWSMELAGAAAVAAIEPDLCSGQVVTSVNSLCTSRRVLLAFTWICTSILLIYLVSLVVLAVSQHHRDPKVWSTSVRTLLTKTVWRPPSAPSSPSTVLPKRRVSADIYTPQPMHSKSPPTYLHRRTSSGYEIESSPTFALPEQMDVPPSSTLREAAPLRPPPPAHPVPALVKPVPRRASPPTTGVRHTASARSPAIDQLGVPQSLPSSMLYANSYPLSAPAPVSSQSASLPSPSLLGDWPRRDIMQQPRQKRKGPPSAFELPGRRAAGVASSEQPIPEPLASDPFSHPRARRPSGPRLRVPSGEHTHRPAPLDLLG